MEADESVNGILVGFAVVSVRQLQSAVGVLVWKLVVAERKILIDRASRKIDGR